MENHGRKWWVAAILAIAASGLGQMYNGQLRKAVAFFAVPLGLIVTASLALSLGMGATAFGVCFAAALLLRAVGVLDAIISAKKQSEVYVLKPCNRLLAYVAMFALASLAALVIRASVVEAFWIPSGNMLPTIQIGDHLYINKMAYGIHLPFVGPLGAQRQPLRNDIVVFTSPVDRNIELIKRVIAVAGDTVELRDRRLFINGEPVPEPHAHFTDSNVQSKPPRDNLGPVTVPSGKFFVMGDNRDQSYDSRYWGFADERDVKG